MVLSVLRLRVGEDIFPYSDLERELLSSDAIVQISKQIILFGHYL